MADTRRQASGYPRRASFLSQKFADKVTLFRVAVPQPRQGRKVVAQGGSPGGRSPHPVRQLTDTPLPRGRERGRGRGRACRPTADAVGYPLSPRQVGADFVNELLIVDTSPLLIWGQGLKLLHFPGCKPTRKGAQLPRRVGRAAHYALRAALLQRNLRILNEASRNSGVRPLYDQVDCSEPPAQPALCERSSAANPKPPTGPSGSRRSHALKRDRLRHPGAIK